MTDPIDKLRQALAAFKGWTLDRVQQDAHDEGRAWIGGSHDDGDFAPVAMVDTGDYFQPALCMPLAQAVSAACVAAPALLAEVDALRAEVARLGTEYRTASGLVHDMYSAATGRAGRLPKLGWLEDVVSAQTELRAEVARLRAALVMADGYIALRCGTPDPQDPYADQVLIDIQAQIKAARTGAEG